MLGLGRIRGRVDIAKYLERIGAIRKTYRVRPPFHLTGADDVRYIVATNGHILVAVQAELLRGPFIGPGEAGFSPPEADQMSRWLAEAKLGPARSVDIERLKAWAGKVSWAEGARTRPGRLYGKVVDRNQLARVLWAFSDRRKLHVKPGVGAWNPIMIHGDGWTALVMPMHPDVEPEGDTIEGLWDASQPELFKAA